MEKSQKIYKKEKRPETTEEYLLKRVLDLEEELTAIRYAQMIRIVQNKEDLEEHAMLLFIWDEVIDNYDSKSCMLTIGDKNVKVPGALQETFHLFQSFKDNPDGGGV